MTYFNFPKGMIILWSGTIPNIPDGWALCNGSNGTPDLRDKFIIGAGDTYSKDDTGGSTTSQAEFSGWSNVGNHAHQQSLTYICLDGASFCGNFDMASDTDTSDIDLSSETSDSFSIMPPYYALAYIMKL